MGNRLAHAFTSDFANIAFVAQGRHLLDWGSLDVNISRLPPYCHTSLTSSTLLERIDLNRHACSERNINRVTFSSFEFSKFDDKWTPIRVAISLSKHFSEITKYKFPGQGYPWRYMFSLLYINMLSSVISRSASQWLDIGWPTFCLERKQFTYSEHRTKHPDNLLTQ
jgi:hypothetical protein